MTVKRGSCSSRLELRALLPFFSSNEPGETRQAFGDAFDGRMWRELLESPMAPRSPPLSSSSTHQTGLRGCFGWSFEEGAARATYGSALSFSLSSMLVDEREEQMEVGKAGEGAARAT